MNWKYKALIQRGFSMVPLGEHLNHLAQRHVTKSLPIPDAAFAPIVCTAKRHLNAVQCRLARPLIEATFYEFGAGWDLAIPLAFYAFGVKHQLLVDVRHAVRPALVNDTIRKFQGITLNFCLPNKPERLLERGRSFLPSLKASYGIEYKAPCDARDTGLAANSIDCITSTSTLEHIPPPDIPAILRECHRLLRDDGVMSFHIDYDDHYSYFDSHISKYNFLRYSNRQWTIFSPKLHYQNRLRHRDYLDLFREAGFETIEERRQDATTLDLETIGKLRLDNRFRAYSAAELAVHNAFTVLRK
ncbi:MAG: class I SAM-dependent methyltransferase [Chloroflexota bacterium]